MSEADRLARVVLSRISEPGGLKLTGAVQALGAEDVLFELEHQGDDTPAKADVAARLRGVDAARELEEAEAKGIRFVIPSDAEWPSQLDGLGHCSPLHQRGGVPVGLWVKGALDLAEATEPAVAVVGSRSATSYGGSVAGELGAGLAKGGYCVVSGAAFGIDQAAHRGALAARGRTVAVLACGVDRAYPEAHRNLLDYITDVGAVVSEAPPGFAPTRIRFLARNRIIAGLTRGTVVVEAAIRSGALNTASWTDALGRPLMGVPGPVTSAPSEGVHQLIRGRGALLVTRTEEVLEAVGPVGTLALAERREKPRVRDLITQQEREVLDAVPVQHGVQTERIARTAGLAPVRTEAVLRTLLEAGLVEHVSGRWRLGAAARTDAS